MKPRRVEVAEFSECDLYCVSTPMRRIPELTQFDSGKSMMRYLPPFGTAGLARGSQMLQPRHIAAPQAPAQCPAREVGHQLRLGVIAIEAFLL